MKLLLVLVVGLALQPATNAIAAPASTETPISTVSIPTLPTPTFTRPPPSNDTFVGSALYRLHQIAYHIQNSIIDFYDYGYDGLNEIGDGGNDMYDGGNRVSFFGPFENISRAGYDQVSNGIGYQAGIHTGYPFNALMWIEEAGGSFSIQVQSFTGADGTGIISTFADSVNYGNVTLEYRVFQIYAATSNDPTICEVYFSVRNPYWYSSGGYVFQTSFSNITDPTVNVAKLVDSPRRMFLGYTLLSSRDGRMIDNFEIRNAMMGVAEAFNKVTPPPPITIPPTMSTSPSSTPTVSSTALPPTLGLAMPVQRSLKAIQAFGDRILQHIDSFYQYIYDGTASSILDGGRDMYDVGNTVSFTRGTQTTVASYGASYSYEDIYFETSAGHPFVALMWIGENSNFHSYTIQVRSDAGADNFGQIAQFNGTIPLTNTIHYQVFQLHGTSDPSIVEVYFTITSFAWGSSPVSLSLNVTSSDQNNLNNLATASSSQPLRNVFFGYMLLSKANEANGLFIDQVEIEQTLVETASVIAEYAFNDNPIPMLNNSTTPYTPTSTTMSSTAPPITRPPPANDTFVGSVLNCLHDVSLDVRSAIAHFFPYNYDSVNRIFDGGEDMYDGGNRISFKGPQNNFTLADYDQVVKNIGYEAGTHTGHPFNALMWIEGVGGSYSIQVESFTGADVTGNITSFSGTVYHGNVTLEYRVFQIHDAGDPTICEVYYTVRSLDWNSWNSYDGYGLETSFSDVTDPTESTATFAGSPTRVFLGYTLLSRVNGSRIQDYEVHYAMYFVAAAFEKVTPPRPPVVPTTQETATTPTSPPLIPTVLVSRSLQALRAFADQVRQQVGNFYRYSFDGGSNSIGDGGNDMYDGGNRVSFSRGPELVNIVYGQRYSFNGIVFESSVGHPFVALMWIGENNNHQSLTLQVSSDAGADGSGTVNQLSGTITLNCTINYEVFQLFGAGDPTIAEVYFTITDDAWGSSPVLLFLDVTSADQNNLLNRATASSPIPLRNVFFGYMLLSKFDGTAISRGEIENVLSTSATIIGNYAFNDISIPTPSPTPPVNQSSPVPPITTSVAPPTRPPPLNDSFVGSVLSCLHQDSEFIVTDDFYYYTYDGIDEISDGGNDMYDGGNRVFFIGPYNNVTQASYDQRENGIGYQAQIHTGYPFNALMWIEDFGGSYSIEVFSHTGADGTGRIATFNGSLTYEGLTLEYRVFQIYEASIRDPTICEVYYSVRNPNWRSEGGHNFRASFSNIVDPVSNRVTLVDSPKRMFLGYMLISSLNGRLIRYYEVESILFDSLRCFNRDPPPPSSTLPPTPTFTSPTRPSTPMSTPTFTTPTGSSTPTFTTPTGSTPPPVADVDFLPSCSLREALRRVWSCESAFTASAPYSDPEQCRSNINTAIHCAANKLMQCAEGEGPNVFRRYNIPLDYQTIIQQIRYLASSSSSCYSHDPITSFCHKAALPSQFGAPFANMTDFFLCHPHATHGIIADLTQFYYAYVGARTAGEVCVAYRKFRDGFVNTVRYQCSLESLRQILDYYHPELYNYVQQAAQVILDSVAVLEISSCPKLAVNNSRSNVSTQWLKTYSKWRYVTLPRWQSSYNRWLESLDSVYYPLPEVPRCRDLTGVSCRNPSQYTCSEDHYSCQFCYCADHQYNGLTRALMQPYLEDFRLWEKFIDEWEIAYNSWEMNNAL